MKKLTMVEGLNQAMHKAMAEDDKVFMLGLDISTGSMGVSLGLQQAFGANRVIDCPAAESGYVGACVGAAITGLRPIAEIQFADFVTYCMDSLVNQAPKMHYWFGKSALFLSPSVCPAAAVARQPLSTPRTWKLCSPTFPV